MDLLPGFCQGIVRVLISYPFDALKVLSQNNGVKPLENLKKEIVKNPLLFYRGVGVPMLTVSIDRAIQYKYFETLKSQYNPYLVGIGLGVFSSLLSVPMQFVTSNVLLLSKTEYGSLFQYMNQIRKTKEGLSTLFKGYFIELPRSSLATGVYLGTYATLRSHLTINRQNNAPNQLQTTVAAVGASWSSWIVVFPLDTLRTLYQVDKTNASLAEILKLRLKQMGVLSLWRGLSPVLMRTVPSSVAGMIVYETVRSKLLANE